MIEIKLILEPFSHALPYDYYNRMHGFISKLMGDNNYGKNYNRYHYTNIIGGENTKDGIIFKDATPYFIIRFDKNDTELQDRFWNNITSCVNLFFGLKLKTFLFEEVDNYKKKTFRTLKQSPILISEKYRQLDDLSLDIIQETESYLLRCIRNKAKACGFKLDERLTINIVNQYNPKTINYNGIQNKGRLFELKINANEATKKFILLNGLGRSCGCAFGFIY